jgi:hypothetical protein
VTLERLADFIAGRAAFVSQKSTVEYCRARAGIYWDKLFLEDEFVRAMEFCRWEAYAAVLEDLAEVALIYLRRCGAEGLPAADAVRGSAWSALIRHPVPPHRASWDDALEEIGARLRRAAMAAPRPVHEVGRPSAKRVFKVLPIHTNLTRQDREVVTNNIRFLLCRVYADMEAELDGAAIGRALTAPPDDAPAAAAPGRRGGAPPAPP